jgi:hypothetical protein
MTSSPALVVTLIFVLVVMAGVAFWVWSMVDMLRFTDTEWRAAGDNQVLFNKWVWFVVTLALGFLPGPGLLVSIVYAVWPRPVLRRVRSAAAPEPGGYGY